MKNSKGKILSAAPSPQDFLSCFSKDEVNFVITLSSPQSSHFTL